MSQYVHVLYITQGTVIPYFETVGVRNLLRNGINPVITSVDPETWHQLHHLLITTCMVPKKSKGLSSHWHCHTQPKVDILYVFKYTYTDHCTHAYDIVRVTILMMTLHFVLDLPVVMCGQNCCELYTMFSDGFYNLSKAQIGLINGMVN